jgi:hypothetical protein
MTRTKVKVRRAKDLPVITRIANSAYAREFPAEEQEFILEENELAFVLHDGNMEFVERIEVEEKEETGEAKDKAPKDVKQP